jgi:hypothetical protein
MEKAHLDLLKTEVVEEGEIQNPTGISASRYKRKNIIST